MFCSLLLTFAMLAILDNVRKRRNILSIPFHNISVPARSQVTLPTEICVWSPGQHTTILAAMEKPVNWTQDMGPVMVQQQVQFHLNLGSDRHTSEGICEHLIIIKLSSRVGALSKMMVEQQVHLSLRPWIKSTDMCGDATIALLHLLLFSGRHLIRNAGMTTRSTSPGPWITPTYMCGDMSISLPHQSVFRGQRLVTLHVIFSLVMHQPTCISNIIGNKHTTCGQSRSFR